ncbi:MAG: 4a-hydroxytetrahydrobiopterin dehydratase [Calditrichia bacterium]
MKVLTPDVIQEKLKSLSGWKLDNDAIKKEWKFRDFKEALRFINKIGELAERHNHHPELFNVYNTVILRFNTHDAGGITEKDFKIAADIDRLAPDRK